MWPEFMWHRDHHVIYSIKSRPSSKYKSSERGILLIPYILSYQELSHSLISSKSKSYKWGLIFTSRQLVPTFPWVWDSFFEVVNSLSLLYFPQGDPFKVLISKSELVLFWLLIFVVLMKVLVCLGIRFFVGNKGLFFLFFLPKPPRLRSLIG